MIRASTPADVPALQAIERAAGKQFADLDMPLVAEDDPLSEPELLAYMDKGRAWTYDARGQPDDARAHPVAYLVADVVDGNAHLEQVSVHPSHARKGIGLALINHLIEWTRAQGLPAITLTTYTEVPWNGPYYERQGFQYLSAEEIPPGLKAIRTAEAAHGLDQWPRACMRLPL